MAVCDRSEWIEGCLDEFGHGGTPDGRAEAERDEGLEENGRSYEREG